METPMLNLLNGTRQQRFATAARPIKCANQWFHQNQSRITPETK